MLGSSNYLGLAGDPRILAAAKDALDKYGSGCTGTRLFNGNTSLHTALEERLAAFAGKEAAMVFSTGFQTNLGIISALVSGQDIVFSDADNHASLWDAIRLSQAASETFAHNDMTALEDLLRTADSDKGRLIVVDGVFSDDGTLADLPALVRLKNQYGARLLVDDSHGVGVMGPTGRGVGEHFDLMAEIDLYVGTFSKAFASLGGFVAGPAQVIEYAAHTAHPYISSAAPPPANVAVVLAALDILDAEPELVAKVYENATYMRKNMQVAGLPLVKGEAPILSLRTGDFERTHMIACQLIDQGVYANPVESRNLLRTCYSALHTHEQLDHALEKVNLVFSTCGLA